MSCASFNWGQFLFDFHHSVYVYYTKHKFLQERKINAKKYARYQSTKKVMTYFDDTVETPAESTPEAEDAATETAPVETTAE